MSQYDEEQEVIDMKECTVDGCETKPVARGLCMKHFKRMRRTGTTNGREVKLCGADGCANKQKLNGLCNGCNERRKFQQRRAEGLCYRCGKVKTEYANCDECRVIINENKRKKRAVQKTS